MAVRKQRRMKTLKGRTVVVKNRSHWDKLVKATLDGKLLIVHYSAVSGTAVNWTACRAVFSSIIISSPAGYGCYKRSRQVWRLS